MNTQSETGQVVDEKTTESLSQDLAEAFNGFDSRMQQLTANLDPDNVRTAGAIALEVGMYANNLAKVLSDLIGVVEVLTAQVVSSTAEPG
jgi:hypothetical protein